MDGIESPKSIAAGTVRQNVTVPTAILDSFSKSSPDGISFCQRQVLFYECRLLKSFRYVLTPHDTKRIANLSKCNVVFNTFDKQWH
jgi:hypothetical protein